MFLVISKSQFLSQPESLDLEYVLCWPCGKWEGNTHLGVGFLRTLLKNHILSLTVESCTQGWIER